MVLVVKTTVPILVEYVKGTRKKVRDKLFTKEDKIRGDTQKCNFKGRNIRLFYGETNEMQCRYTCKMEDESIQKFKERSSEQK